MTRLRYNGLKAALGASLTSGVTVSYSSAVLADTPLAYYRLGESTGTTMVDSSGNARNGTYGASAVLAEPGLLAGDTDKAVRFTGAAASHGTVPLASWMQPATITVEAIMKYSGSGGSQTIAARMNWGASFGPGYSWNLLTSGNTITCQLFVGNGSTNVSVGSSPVTVPGGVPNHVAFTFDGSIVRLYLNGTQVGSGAISGSLSPGSESLYIGRQTYTGDGFYTGTVDEVAIYGTALSAARIAAHAALVSSGSSGLPSGTTTITFAAPLTHSNGTAVPTIAGSDYIPLTILTSAGDLSEIVYLTAYTAGATTGIITRGQEGTVGVTHAAADKVICSPLIADLVGLSTPATPKIVSKTSAYADSGSTVSLTVPAVSAGDLIVIQSFSSYAATGISAGYSTILVTNDYVSPAVHLRTADGTEAGTTVTVTQGGSAQIAAYLTVVRGAGGVIPPTEQRYGGTAGTTSAVSTLSAPGALVLAAAAFRGTSGTVTIANANAEISRADTSFASALYSRVSAASFETFNATSTVSGWRGLSAIAILPVSSGSAAPTSVPSIAGYSSSYSDSANPFTVAVPSGAAVGDQLVVFVLSNYQCNAIPAGWTRLGPVWNDSYTNAAMAAKTCEAGDLGGTLSFGFNGSEGVTLWCVAVRGAAVMVDGDVSQRVFSTTPAMSSLTGAKEGDLVIAFGGSRNGTGTNGFDHGDVVAVRADAHHKSAVYKLYQPDAAFVKPLVYGVTSGESGATAGIIFRGKTVAASAGDGGGGGGTSRYDNPTDVLWGTPSAYDLEFTTDDTSGTLPSGWAWVNQGTSTYKQQWGAALVVPQTSGSDSNRLLVRSLPSGSTWEAVAKIQHAGFPVSWLRSGLVLRDSTNSKFTFFGLASGGGWNNGEVFINDWTSETSYAGNESHTLVTGTMYFKIRKNSSTWDFMHSPDGVSWNTFTVGKTAWSTYDQLGFGFHSNRTDWSAAVHWLRVR